MKQRTCFVAGVLDLLHGQDLEPLCVEALQQESEHIGALLARPCSVLHINEASVIKEASASLKKWCHSRGEALHLSE